jgi:hypothetical protein
MALKIEIGSKNPRQDLQLKQLSKGTTLTAFLTKETRKRVADYLEGDPKKPNAPLDPKALAWTWKTLLIEAIHFLRINDSRERGFLRGKKRSEWNKKHKTSMRDDGAAKAAQLNAYGIEPLYKYFEQFTDFETTLYGVDTHYRDHVEHPILVWLLGMRILDRYGDRFRFRSGPSVVVKKSRVADPAWACFAQQKTKCKGHRCKKCTKKENCNQLTISTAELGAMWTIAALTHDLGYPLEKVERINDRLEHMLGQFGQIGFQRSTFQFTAQHDHLVQTLLRIVGSTAEPLGKNDRGRWRTRLRSKYHTKFARSWESFDHGIVSSLILVRALTFFLETDISQDDLKPLSNEDARQFVIRSEILHAIAAHTVPKVYHLGANTLPFLLVLCDDLQEWGRPTMSDMKAGDLTGSARLVKLRIDIRKNRSDIRCAVVHKKWPYPAQGSHARRVFKVWHERLRPALDDTNRKMKLVWSISFGSRKEPWRLSIDSRKNDAFRMFEAKMPNEFGRGQKPFELYDDERDLQF